MLVYKALQGQSPVYIRKLLQVYTPTRDLRSQNNATVLVVPKSCKVMLGNRSFATAAPRYWNSLTEGIKDSGSLAIFKKIPENTLFSYKFTDNKLLVCVFTVLLKSC